MTSGSPGVCAAPGCDRPTIARGWCITHYKQARRNGWALPPAGPEIGAPSGHGRYGILDRDEETVLCHECGRRLQALGWHLRTAHEMTVDEYRTAHGLPRGLGLVCLGLHQRYSEQGQERVGTPGWRRLEAARDPLGASQARDLTAPSAPAVHAERAATAPTHLPSRPARQRTCPYCGRGYTGRARTCGGDECARQHRSTARAAQHRTRYRPLTTEEVEQLRELLDQPGFWPLATALMGERVSASEIARAVGRSNAWVSTHRPRPSETPEGEHR